VEWWCTATRGSSTGAPRTVLLECFCPIVRLSFSWEATTTRTGAARTGCERLGRAHIGTGRGAPPPVYKSMVATHSSPMLERAQSSHHHCPCPPSLCRHARRHPWKPTPPRPWWAVPRLVESAPLPHALCDGTAPWPTRANSEAPTALAYTCWHTHSVDMRLASPRKSIDLARCTHRCRHLCVCAAAVPSRSPRMAWPRTNAGRSCCSTQRAATSLRSSPLPSLALPPPPRPHPHLSPRVPPRATPHLRQSTPPRPPPPPPPRPPNCSRPPLAARLRAPASRPPKPARRHAPRTRCTSARSQWSSPCGMRR